MAEDLDCPICLEEYDLAGRQPRMLLCSGSHELCAECVAKLKVQEGRWHCPQCREPVRAISNPNRSLTAALEINIRVTQHAADLAATVAEAQAAKRQRSAARKQRATTARRQRAEAPTAWWQAVPPWTTYAIGALAAVICGLALFWLGRWTGAPPQSVTVTSFYQCVLEIDGPAEEAYKDPSRSLVQGSFREVWDLAHMEKVEWSEVRGDTQEWLALPGLHGLVRFDRSLLRDRDQSDDDTYYGTKGGLPKGFWKTQDKYSDPGEILADYMSIRLRSKLDGRVVHIKREGLEDSFAWGGSQGDGGIIFSYLDRDLTVHPQPRGSRMVSMQLHHPLAAADRHRRPPAIGGGTLLFSLGGGTIREQESLLSSLQWVY